MIKKYSSLIIILLTLVGCVKNDKVLMFVGTYTNGDSKGIYGYYFDQEAGNLFFATVTPNQEDPSFLAVSPDKKYLFAVAEITKGPEMDSGSIVSYKILDEGRLEKINKQTTKGHNPCHVDVSPDGKTVVVSNYSSGNLSLFHVDSEGKLSELFQQIQHEGSGPNEARQKHAYAHSALFDESGELLVSADLGNDKIEFYKRNASGTFLPTEQEYVAMDPGAGPRHFAFSPDWQFIYVINELQSTVSVLQRNGEEFKLVETKSSLPADFNGKNFSADIHVSQDGRFVYCSNRGHHSIAVFERNPSNGKIKLIQNEFVQGDWPRNFALSPNGKFLLVANQKSNNITIFKVDKKTGKLSFTNKEVKNPSPVCLKFLVK